MTEHTAPHRQSAYTPTEVFARRARGDSIGEIAAYFRVSRDEIRRILGMASG